MLGYQTDANGYLTGTITLREDPMEPGKHLTPGGATQVPPPAHTNLQRAVWDGFVWAVEDIPVVTPDPGPTPEEILAAKREGAQLTKPEFLIAAKTAGIITAQEALDSSKGVMPPTFQAAIDAAVSAGSLTAEEAENATILWPSVATIHRNSPLIDIAAAGYGITDPTYIDALFGIT